MLNNSTSFTTRRIQNNFFSKSTAVTYFNQNRKQRKKTPRFITKKITQLFFTFLFFYLFNRTPLSAPFFGMILAKFCSILA